MSTPLPRTMEDVANSVPVFGYEKATTDFNNPYINGETVLDEQGRLLKSYITYSRKASSKIQDYYRYMTQFKRLVESTKISLSARTHVELRDVVFEPPMMDEMGPDGKNVRRRMLPRDARVGNLTYEGRILASVIEADSEGFEISRLRDQEGKTVYKLIGWVPVMTGSWLCVLYNKSEEEIIDLGESPADPFGWFINRGVENALMMMDQLRMNKPICSVSAAGAARCLMTNDDIRGTKLVTVSTTSNGVMQVRLTLDAEDRDIPFELNILTFLRWIGGGSGSSYINRLLELFPPSYAIKAREYLLGTIQADHAVSSPSKIVIPLIAKIKREKISESASSMTVLAQVLLSSSTVSEMVSEVLLQLKVDDDELLVAEISKTFDKVPSGAESAEKAANSIIRELDARSISYSSPETEYGLREIELRTEVIGNLMPQTPIEEVDNKVNGLLILVYKMLMVRMGAITADSKDHWKNKRIKTPGEILFRRMSKKFGKLVKFFEEKVASGKTDPTLASFDLNFKSMNSLRSSFSSNEWGVTVPNGDEPPAISQTLQRRTPLDTHSHLSKVMSKTGKSSRNIRMRLVDPSQLLIVCLAQTQDGSSTGLNKPLAIGVWITLPSSGNLYVDLILGESAITPVETEENTTECVINNEKAGWCNIDVLKSILDRNNVEYGLRTDADTASEITLPKAITLTKLFNLSIFSTRSAASSTPLMVNGRFLGWCVGWDARNKLKKMKLRGEIPRTTCVVFEKALNILFVYFDGHRATVPLLRINTETGKLLMEEEGLFGSDFITLREAGMIEYLDPWEMDEDAVIAESFAEIDMARRERENLTANIEALKAQSARKDPEDEVVVYLTKDENMEEVILSPSDLPGWQVSERAKIAERKDSMISEITGAEAEIRMLTESVLSAPNDLQNDVRKRMLELDAGVQMAEARVGELEGILDINDEIADELTEEQLIVLAESQEKTRVVEMELESLRRTLETLESHRSAFEGLVLKEISDERRLQKESASTKIVELQEKIENKKEDLEILTTRENIVNSPSSSIVEKEIERLERMMRTHMETKVFTHCMMDPNAVWGTAVSMLPHANHNDGPRNAFGASQYMQAVGVGTGGIYSRFDTSGKRAVNAQPPMTDTQQKEMFGLDRAPSSMNMIVAIMTTGGPTQEDGIEVSARYARNGGGLVAISHTHSAGTEVKDDSRARFRITEKFGLPEEIRRFKRQPEVYELLDPNTNAARPGLRFKRGTQKCLIARHSIHTKSGTTKMFDTSIYANFDEKGVVENVAISKTLIKVETVEYRSLRVGDKMSTRSAQKQVVTRLVPDDELYYYKHIGPDGKTYKVHIDAVINPLALVTRQTLDLMLEPLESPHAIIKGVTQDTTAFKKPKIGAEYAEELKRYGFSPNGRYRLYRGKTGELVESEIFVGPISYNRLIPMSTDKIQSRGAFRKTGLNKQPVRGRGNIGGLRLSELVRDAVIGHGALSVLKERGTVSSDGVEVVFCQKCGIPASFNAETSEYSCLLCKRKHEEPILMRAIVKAAFMARIREMQAMNIDMHLLMRPDNQKRLVKEAGGLVASDQERIDDLFARTEILKQKKEEREAEEKKSRRVRRVGGMTGRRRVGKR